MQGPGQNQVLRGRAGGNVSDCGARCGDQLDGLDGDLRGLDHTYGKIQQELNTDSEMVQLMLEGGKMATWQGFTARETGSTSTCCPDEAHRIS